MNIEAYIEKNYKIVILILVVASILFSLIFLQFTVDDSYIAFRYAKNFVEHGVWNWNIKGEKVEAYTSFLYAILAIIPEELGINAAIFFKFLGVISIIYLSTRLFNLVEDKIVYLMALTFLLFNPFTYIHAYSGLETPLFMVLLFELTIRISKEEHMSLRQEKLLLLVMLVLPLTRPEGALFSFLVAFFLLFDKEKNIQSKGFFLTIVVLGVGYFLSRYQYFGYIFPNTFYVKSNHDLSIVKVIKYTVMNFQYLGSAFVLLFLIENKYFRTLLIASILLNIFLYGNSDLAMNYADRFPFQTLLPLFLCSLVLAKKGEKTSVIIFVFMAFILGGFFTNRETLKSLATYYPYAVQSHAKLGVALSKYKDENLSLMVGDAGMIPYFSDWHSYDANALANAYLAHKGFSRDYMRHIKPDLIILYGRMPDEEVMGEDYSNQGQEYKYVADSKQYSVVGAIPWDHNYYLLCYLKNSIPRFEEIKQTIQHVEENARKFKISKEDFVVQKYLIYPALFYR